MTRERRLNDFLLAVTKSIFQELISMDAVMLKIMVKKIKNYHFSHHKNSPIF
jgi:hypothetical protein